MVHIEIPAWLHLDLCILKPKARAFWLDYWKDNLGCRELYKGKVSMEEVIRYLMHSKR